MNLMLFWGVVGLIQLGLLPGAILLGAVRPRLGWLERLGLTFGLSLLCNYVLAAGLALAGWYTRTGMLAVLVVELSALAWIYWGWMKSSLSDFSSRLAEHAHGAASEVAETLFPGAESAPGRGTFHAYMMPIAAGLGLVGIAWVVSLMVRNLGGVFNTWDAVLSWNRWAVTWAGGVFPPDTGYYPQLLPANWSLTYVLMGNAHIQIFARATGPLFLLMILLLMVGLGLRTRSYGTLLGAFLTWVVARGYLSEFVADGYADLPAAFLGFTGVLMLLRIQAGASGRERRTLLWFGALLSAAAALTKPSGVYLLVLFPLLGAVLPEWGEGGERKVRWKEILLPFGAGLLLAGSFYAAKAVGIGRGLDESNVNWVTQGIYGGAGWLERLGDAWQNLGIYRWLFVWLVPALALVRPRVRWLIGAVTAPYLLIWGAFFSYDTRNLAIVLPLAGLAAGLGVEGALEAIQPGLQKLRVQRVPMGFWALGGALLLLAVSLAVTDGRLARLQTARQEQILSPQLNGKLYDYFGGKTPDRKILSQYPVSYLPGFEDMQVSFWFDNLADFLNAVSQPDVGYILLPERADGEILDVVEAKLAAGEYQKIFEDASYLPVSFLRIVRSNGP